MYKQLDLNGELNTYFPPGEDQMYSMHCYCHLHVLHSTYHACLSIWTQAHNDKCAPVKFAPVNLLHSIVLHPRMFYINFIQGLKLWGPDYQAMHDHEAMHDYEAMTVMPQPATLMITNPKEKQIGLLRDPY